MKGNKILLNHNLYGNIEVYSPNMDFMFYCNQRKLNSYLKKELAINIGENKYQLTFTPNGLGYSDENNDKILNQASKRENICVVTGKKENLTKHHIVPRVFRKHLPMKYKTSYILVVLIDVLEHQKYTREEQIFYDVLAAKYGVKKMEKVEKSLSWKAKSIAHALITHSNAIPELEQVRLKNEFTEITGLDATDKNLNSIKGIWGKIRKNENTFAIELVSKITDIDEFERIWVNHFVRTTNPKFLPKDLILNYL